MTSKTDNKVEVAVEFRWSCDDRDSQGGCRNPHGCHCAEITALLSSKEAADQRCERLAAEVERLPYRAEYGAVHHKDTEPGFVFTVSPPAFAEDIAAALNDRDRLADNYAVLEAETVRLREIEGRLFERGFTTGAEAVVFIDSVLDRAEAAEAKLSALVEELTKADECFEAAYAEGLLDVLAASDDANLCDLVNRRILMAREPIWRAIASLDRTAPGKGPKLVGWPKTTKAKTDVREFVSDLAAEPAQEVAGLVEKVARIIDPLAYADFPVGGAEPDHDWWDRQRAMDKAKAILAALSSSPSQGGETVDRSELAATDNNHLASVAEAFRKGAMAALGCARWDDADDFFSLVGLDYAQGKPFPPTMPKPKEAADNNHKALVEAVQLIAAGWEVIESDGWTMTIQAPEHWDEPGERERVVDTAFQSRKEESR